ncbi:MAG: hypothetical protein LBG08_02060 [Spirochaetaceae bacterium]|jgi:hypothetical protein|nr:hypothetical protein [Spirochaetaceae bacterium]
MDIADVDTGPTDEDASALEQGDASGNDAAEPGTIEVPVNGPYSDSDSPAEISEWGYPLKLNAYEKYVGFSFFDETVFQEQWDAWEKMDLQNYPLRILPKTTTTHDFKIMI